MEITNNATATCVDFLDLTAGDVFIYEDATCMKVENPTVDQDAVNLADGTDVVVPEDEKVQSVTANLTLTN